MDITSLLVSLATIVAGVLAAIQLGEWLRNWRRTRIRTRTRIYTAGMPGNRAPLKIVNFSHPLSDRTLEQIRDETGHPVGEVIRVSTQFNDDRPFYPHTVALVDKAGISPEEWQQGRILVVPPGFSPVTSTVLAEIHGRMGHFPTIIRLRAVAGSKPQEYELAEIINLQVIRDTARKSR